MPLSKAAHFGGKCNVLEKNHQISLLAHNHPSSRPGSTGLYPCPSDTQQPQDWHLPAATASKFLIQQQENKQIQQRLASTAAWGRSPGLSEVSINCSLEEREVYLLRETPTQRFREHVSPWLWSFLRLSPTIIPWHTACGSGPCQPPLPCRPQHPQVPTIPPPKPYSSL